MGVLSDRWSSDLTGTDGPNWLVGDDNLRPCLNRVFDGIELCLENFVGLTSFTLLKGLTDAQNCVETSALCLCRFLGDDFVGLTIELSALGVTDESPLVAKVNDLLGTDLTSECTVAFSTDVLSSALNVHIQHRPRHSQVKNSGGNDDLDRILVDGHAVQRGAHLANEFN